MFVLTGTAAVLPKVVDQQQGTVTGASLRFHEGDENVVVSNGGDNAGQRVRTETRVKNKE
jgi:lipopolysaccharide export system protein LptA